MYLFFVRAFNDIDHITPIVWKMHQSHHPVGVYCLNPEYDIQHDYRLNFLRNLGNPDLLGQFLPGKCSINLMENGFDCALQCLPVRNHVVHKSDS